LTELASTGLELTRNEFEQGGEEKKKNGHPDQRNRSHCDPESVKLTRESLSFERKGLIGTL